MAARPPREAPTTTIGAGSRRIIAATSSPIVRNAVAGPGLAP